MSNEITGHMIFDWHDLQDRQLTIEVVEDSENLMVFGKDSETGEMFLLHGEPTLVVHVTTEQVQDYIRRLSEVADKEPDEVLLSENEMDELQAMQELRPAVRRFVLVMEQVLRTHDETKGKLGWIGEDISLLIQRLNEEVEELEAIFEAENLYDQTHVGAPRDVLLRIAKESVDVGNFAMMIHDLARHELASYLPKLE